MEYIKSPVMQLMALAAAKWDFIYLFTVQVQILEYFARMAMNTIVIILLLI